MSPVIAAALCALYERVAGELEQAKEPLTLDVEACAVVARGLRAGASAMKPRAPVVAPPAAPVVAPAKGKPGRKPKDPPRPPEQQKFEVAKRGKWECGKVDDAGSFMGHVFQMGRCEHCGVPAPENPATAAKYEAGGAP